MSDKIAKAQKAKSTTEPAPEEGKQWLIQVLSLLHRQLVLEDIKSELDSDKAGMLNALLDRTKSDLHDLLTEGQHGVRYGYNVRLEVDKNNFLHEQLYELVPESR